MNNFFKLPLFVFAFIASTAHAQFQFALPEPALASPSAASPTNRTPVIIVTQEPTVIDFNAPLQVVNPPSFDAQPNPVQPPSDATPVALPETPVLFTDVPVVPDATITPDIDALTTLWLGRFLDEMPKTIVDQSIAPVYNGQLILADRLRSRPELVPQAQQTVFHPYQRFYQDQIAFYQASLFQIAKSYLTEQIVDFSPEEVLALAQWVQSPAFPKFQQPEHYAFLRDALIKANQEHWKQQLLSLAQNISAPMKSLLDQTKPSAGAITQPPPTANLKKP